MSVELYSVSEPGENNASLKGMAVFGRKPLHRFIKGQPKTIGIMVLVLGLSFISISIAIMPDSSFQFIWPDVLPRFLLGTLFIICGILYILTEHNPTKKTVTISLALSIVNILVACWTVLYIVPSIVHVHYYRYDESIEDNYTHWSSHEAMEVSMELIFLFYSVVGAIICIVMSCLAVAALRSTKSQTIVMMTTKPAEIPVE